MALLPVMSRQSVEDRPGLERSYHLAVKLMFGLALPVAVATTFLAYPLINLLGGPRYLPDGAIALQLMVWFIPIGWINSLTNYVLIALDQQKAMRWAFLAGVSFNIVANLIFIPQYGYRAAAVVTIFSEAVLLTSFYMLLRKALAPVPWLSLLWKFGSAGLAMAAIMVVLWPVAPLLALILGGAAYPLALLILRPFSAWELRPFCRAAAGPGDIMTPKTLTPTPLPQGEGLKTSSRHPLSPSLPEGERGRGSEGLPLSFPCRSNPVPPGRCLAGPAAWRRADHHQR